ncbi:MAG: HEPN domain-containing protein [Nanoarchaeota archaeon]|nr:HEPN domain-containing protein [Nanoarchaeota archaeon]
MDSMDEIYIERANNELLAAYSLKKLSEEPDAKKIFNIPLDTTFFSSVISHSYYAIFYAAKSILLTKGIKTVSPEIHRKTLEAFKKYLVETGILDVKLLEIYKSIVIRADALFEIFKAEKKKRGDFTYTTIPQANKGFAEDSLKNAQIFVSNIEKTLRKK